MGAGATQPTAGRCASHRSTSGRCGAGACTVADVALPRCSTAPKRCCSSGPQSAAAAAPGSSACCCCCCWAGPSACWSARRTRRGKDTVAPTSSSPLPARHSSATGSAATASAAAWALLPSCCRWACSSSSRCRTVCHSGASLPASTRGAAETTCSCCSRAAAAAAGPTSSSVCCPPKPATWQPAAAMCAERSARCCRVSPGRAVSRNCCASRSTPHCEAAVRAWSADGSACRCRPWRLQLQRAARGVVGDSGGGGEAAAVAGAVRGEQPCSSRTDCHTSAARQGAGRLHPSCGGVRARPKTPVRTPAAAAQGRGGA